MMPGIYEYHRWTPGNMVQQINSCSDILFLSKNTCSDILFLSKKPSIIDSLLTASLPTSSSCPSTLGRSVFTSPYLGDVAREKRLELKKKLLKRENGFCTFQPIDALHKGRTILLAMARQGRGLPLLCSLPKSLDRLQPSQGGIVSSEKEARRTFKVVYKSPIDGKPVQSHAFDA